MLRISFAAALALIALAAAVLPAEARPRRAQAPACGNFDLMRPCQVDFSGGRDSARGAHALKPAARYMASRAGRARPGASHGLGAGQAEILAHPAGCPARAFCGCGAAVKVFGRPIRELWLAAAWFRFPRAAPGAGMVAVRRHHVFVLEVHVGGDTWLAYDANSGGRATRRHARSIAGYVIVNPHAALAAFGSRA